MKKLLLSSILLLGSLSSFAQDDCSTPLVAVIGTNTAPAVAGVWEASCFNLTADNTGGPINGLWYSYTPTSDGEVTISSDLAANVAPNSVDTMISIMTGTCGTLNCVASDDDVSATNYLSSVTFPVAAGVTYYIEWSNYWDGAGFDFDLSFTAISCLGTYSVNLPTNTTTTSVTLNWDASLSNPANYEVEYGAQGFTQGTGTTLSPATNSVNVSGLAAETVYDYYVRANCGTTQSTWTTVNKFTTAKLCPELATFDNATQLVGWTTSGNTGAYGVGTTAANAQGGTGQYWIFNNSIDVATNNWLISPAFSLQAGEQVTVSFYERNATANGLRSLRVTVGTTPSVAAQTTQLYSNAALLNNTYTQITVPAWTAPAAGTYYFGFNDNSALATTTAATTMRFDTVNFTSVLGTSDFLSSKFSVFPNPVTNVINFSNNANALVSTVEMTDMNGRVIKSDKVNATEGQISVSDLATGMYMMKITTDQGVAVKKIVKQ
ncbi:T9SS type A sorting domain-containing protein [Flavobacterium paronense]|uniref:T9SS type A sorting domain-containing protein n=1 Tax=Flavobacterium paronense TaxID=1392775 RepID=A0ABV5GGE0_9FLAO|nr:T9SS type A sorting domain-containing protein [Flavobacterium paronense]MDN3677087.1 T9SS type A sorting domain-containing protein [Flavobacterium paronense]